MNMLAWTLELVPVVLLLNLVTIPFFAVAAAFWGLGFFLGRVSVLAEEFGPKGSTSLVILAVLIPTDLAMVVQTVLVPQLVTLDSPGYLAAALFGGLPGYCLAQHLKHNKRHGPLRWSRF